MTVMQLDREYLVRRCEILNDLFDEQISKEMAQVRLDLLDFEFETLVALEMIPTIS